ncbi:FAD/NAD(P)-binding domain-containing protein [Rhizopogon vinicolor AM-OR11-026]|uniref:FAD/NAD(P)-binding domain-containing protein n=1 Tax=Rhizopogon vinicolor AM-OR11-026 TaxID=1314800 RepID=A0A1B7MR06_9AGAM|nr:FAD/NAD(P)-binding domain-containing protein [Rhizopogon vinicolor AM-OR11-026]
MASSNSTSNGLRHRYRYARYVGFPHSDTHHARHGQGPIGSPIGHHRWTLNLILSPFFTVFRFVYITIQKLIVLLFKPNPPPEYIQHPYGRIAVIGAGLTGISSAAHAISHGFEVVIYEASDRPGGIWSRENKSSGLQLNSLLYRFHPAVIWKETYPKKDEILDEIDKIWKEYRLKERTRLNTPVTKVKRLPRKSEDSNSNASFKSPSQWLINDGEDGPFDALIVTIGTCGDPMWVPFEGMPSNAGKVGIKEAEAGDQETDGVRKEHQDGDEEVSKSKLHNEAKKRRKHRKKAREAGEEPAPEDADDASDAKRSGFPGEEGTYKGPVLHSSQLDHATPELLSGKTVVVIGSGASAVEAVETALERGAKKAVVLAREDKWIIPRNMIFDTFLAAQPFGREMPLSFLWERLLKYWHYHGVEDLMPNKGIFSGTPVVNDEFLNHVRSGTCVYIRGDTLRLTPTCVRVKIREQVERGSPLGFGGGVRKRDLDVSGVVRDQLATEENNKGKGSAEDESSVEDINADVIILATGYKRPDASFLPSELFPEGYDASSCCSSLRMLTTTVFQRPNLYLQNFSTEDWSVLMTNSSYLNAIGTVGHFHIGIYTRILLTLLLDPRARPSPKDMKLWVDAIGFIKRGASGGALSFFTYMELTIWLLAFHILRPDRLRWLPFIMLGWGVRPDDFRLHSEA